MVTVHTADNVLYTCHMQGPLPVFTAENSWAPPRTVTLSRVEEGFGFSIRGSKPITISGVDKGGQAEVLHALLDLTQGVATPVGSHNLHDHPDLHDRPDLHGHVA